MYKKVTGSVVAAIALALALFGGSMHSSPPAHAAPLNALVVSQSTCFLIGTAFGGGAAIECADPNNVTNLSNPINLQNFANRLAKRPVGDPTLPTYNDFKGIDLDKNQLHEHDGTFFVIVFLSDEGPVDITTTNASIKTGAGVVGRHYICDSESVDADCVSGGVAGDGALVFAVVPDATTTRGAGLITVVQSQVPLDLPFTVVGEPHSIALVALKTTLQAGASDIGAKDTNPDNDCILQADAAGFLKANGTAERTVFLAVVKDSDGTPITGASVFWTTDDASIAQSATNFTPTIDLGANGIAAPEIGCGTKNAGTTKIHVQTVAVGPPGSPAVGIPVDPDAPQVSASLAMTIVGPPAALSVVADPASLTCDGTAASKVSATVTDAAGNPAASGQPVTFDVQTLGTANPIVAKTDDKGVATSMITPLTAGTGAKGVTVNVSTKNVSTQTTLATAGLIACSGEAAGAGTVPPPGQGTGPGGGAGAGTGGPTGTITGPDTGSGGDLAGAGSLSWWPALALALAAAALGAGRLAVARLETRRR